MKNDTSTDYIAAFIVGTLLGAGAALLLAPDPPTRREKIMKEIEPYRKQLRKRSKSARKRVGRQASAATDAQLKAEIYSYSRSRGLFAGMALEGAVLQPDDGANAAAYGGNVSSWDVFENRVFTTPPLAQQFKQALAQYAPPPQR